MISPKIFPLFRVICVFLVLLTLPLKVSTQCNPPDQLPTIDCESAPFVCLNNACYETLNNQYFCCNGWCGSNTAVHNPQYFLVVPTEPCVTIHIYVNSCNSGNALQAAIIGACPWVNSDVLSCNPGAGVGQTMMLTTCGLIPGNPIWLLIDGSSGATCEYTINFVAGIELPGLYEDVTQGEAVPDYVCQGFANMTLNASPQVGNAHGYMWFLPWTPPNMPITSTLPTTTVSVPAGWPPGIYQACVQAFSGCDTMDHQVCFPFEVYAIPPEIKNPITLCPEDFPINWGPLTISGPGSYHRTFTDPNGCTYDSTWMVNLYPSVPVGQLDILHCGESYIYEGTTYYDAGTFLLQYPGQGLNGCDSTAELELTLAHIDAFIELTCVGGEFHLTPLIQDLVPFNAPIDWEWYFGGQLVHDNLVLITTEDGCYDLTATVHTNAGSCTFPIPQFCFAANALQPLAPNLGFTDTTICAQAGVVFEVIVPPTGGPFSYTWSGPPNVFIIQDGSNEAVFDFTFAGPSEICVYATNTCGDGPVFCFDVEIQPTPVASFDYELQVCADSTTVITFTGSASPTAIVTWNFSNPTTLVGTGLGPYTVSWDTPGSRIVSLNIEEPGCSDAYTFEVINVTTFSPPVVNCSSTISSVEFSWNAVTGATGYLVSINGAPGILIDSTTFFVGGLDPSEAVQLTLTAVSGNACGDIIVMHSCSAEDCPAPTIELSGANTACLNSPSIIDLEALVNGSPGTGTWAGPGIVDVNLGHFDPVVATAGLHQVTFTTLFNGCPFSAPYQITVFDSLTADFTIDPVICITDVATVTYTGNASAAAIFNYTFTPGMVVTGSGEGPYTIRWASPGPKTVRLQVSENGCNSDIVSESTTVVATLNAPVVNCAPDTSDVVFSWTPDPVGTTSVNSLSGHTGVQTGNSMEFTGLMQGDEVIIEIITTSAGPCPERRDTFSCTAKECPPVLLSIAAVPGICLYAGTPPVGLQVTITNGNGGTGQWAGPGVTDVVTGAFSPSLAGAGAHVVTYTYMEDGCEFLASTTVNISDPPTAFISNTNPTITCTAGSVVLNGSGSSGGFLSYQWSTANGNIMSGASTAMATVNTAGTYQLLVSTPEGCRDSATIMVTQDASIPTANAGPDKMLTCDSLSFVIGGASSTGATITYQWTTSNGNLVGPTDQIRATANATGDYTLTVRDISNGCEISDVMTINIDTVVAAITITPGDIIDCDTPISTAESSLAPPGSYTYIWTTADGTIEGSATGPNINVSQGGTYNLTIRNMANGCTRAESVVIDESDEIIDAVDVSLMNIRCHGENNGALIINSVDGGTPPYTYEWSVSPSGSTMLTSLAPGQYSLTVSDQNGCSIVQVYNLAQPDLVTLDIGPNRTVSHLDSVRMSISTNLNSGNLGNITWGGYNGVFCPGCPVFEIIATTSATISAMISDTAGCVATDSMRLTVVVPRIYYIPNVFSPNGDNINDYFYISGRFNLTNISFMRIYDRWGNQLWERTNLTPGVEQQGWDGRFREEVMQPGVYVYVAELQYEDGRSETVTGDITIVR